MCVCVCVCVCVCCHHRKTLFHCTSIYVLSDQQPKNLFFILTDTKHGIVQEELQAAWTEISKNTINRALSCVEQHS